MVALYCFFFVLFFQPVITGDGLGYYAYIRSMIIDGDLDFYNEFKFYNTRGSALPDPEVKTSTGLVHNLWSIGPSILFAPWFLMGHAFALLTGSALDGYSFWYVIWVGIGATIYSFCGSMILYLICHRFLRFSSSVSFLSASTIFLASPLIYYTFYVYSYSHVFTHFVSALFFLAWLMFRGREEKKYWFIQGSLLGLLALMRWQSVLIGVIPILDILMNSKGSLRKNTPRLALNFSIYLASMMVVFSPQIVAWDIIYGSPFVIPQDEYTKAKFGMEQPFVNWFSPKIIEVLFSQNHGLYLWTPAFFLATLGLAILYRRDKRMAFALIVAFALQIYVNSTASDVHAGYSFGARRFLDLTPVFAVGFAAFLQIFDRNSKKFQIMKVGIPICLTLWNLIFMLQYIYLLPQGEAVDFINTVIPQGFYLATELVLRHATFRLCALNVLTGHGDLSDISQSC
jgi:hypothetical protein